MVTWVGLEIVTLESARDTPLAKTAKHGHQN